MIKTYTITIEGLSDGNTISAPFEIVVKTLKYEQDLKICAFTINEAGKMCKNDDVKDVLSFDLPEITSNKSGDLASTIEVLLEEVYPGKWS